MSTRSPQVCSPFACRCDRQSNTGESERERESPQCTTKPVVHKDLRVQQVLRGAPLRRRLLDVVHVLITGGSSGIGEACAMRRAPR